MAEQTTAKGSEIMSTNNPETIQIHIIWRGKLDVFSVAQGKNTTQQILFAAAKLNQVLTARDKK